MTTAETKEKVVKEKRYWLRIANECNNRCMFCLDAESRRVPPAFDALDRIQAAVSRARAAGYDRLILSGGEATIHPDFIDIIRRARQEGFEQVQVITNGRMFSYPSFAARAVAAGLTEATFSVHGHTSDLHDRLTGMPGAFAQARKGIANLLRLGQCVVNIDVVVNRLNYAHVETIMRQFSRLGIREYDLLRLVPFGAAFTHRDTLFFTREEAAPYLERAFAFGRRPGFHLWTNRFPPDWLEGHESLIQDPRKLYDEVLGRKDLYDGYFLINRFHCYPHHCETCFIQGFCRKFLLHARGLKNGSGIRNLAASRIDDRLVRRLVRMLVKNSRPVGLTTDFTRENRDRLSALAKTHPTVLNRVVFRTEQSGVQAKIPPLPWQTDLEIPAAGPDLFHRPLPDGTRVILPLTRANRQLVADHAGDIRDCPSWIAFRLPAYERLPRAREAYAETEALLPDLGSAPVINCAPCIAPGGHFSAGPTLDLDLLQPDGRPDLTKLVGAYIRDDYYVKSRRCRDCIHTDDCRGMPLNYVREFGFRRLNPLIS